MQCTHVIQNLVRAHGSSDGCVSISPKSKRAVTIGLLFCFLLFSSTSYTSLAKKGTHIVITPSGDMTGVADANAIEDALKTVALIGGTVELRKGRFYVSRVIEVEEFTGVFKGAGKDKTIIEAVENSDPGSYLYEHPNYGPLTGMFYFLNPSGDVQIHGLTVEIKVANPAAEWHNPWGGLVTALNNVFDLWAASDLTQEYNTVVTQVKILGASGDFLGQNIAFPICIEGNHPGYKSSFHLVENCDFENIGGTALEHWELPGSSVTVKSSTFRNIGWWAHFVYTCDVVIFSDNIITDCRFYGGIGVRDCNGGLVHDNLFRDLTYINWATSSIYLRNAYNLVVSSNEFVNARGIHLVRGSSRNVIVNNDYRQSGLPGWAKLDTIPSEYGCVWLWGDENPPPTAENLVIEWLFPEGTTLEDQVLDEGVDNRMLELPMRQE